MFFKKNVHNAVSSNAGVVKLFYKSKLGVVPLAILEDVVKFQSLPLGLVDVNVLSAQFQLLNGHSPLDKAAILGKGLPLSVHGVSFLLPLRLNFDVNWLVKLLRNLATLSRLC